MGRRADSDIDNTTVVPGFVGDALQVQILKGTFRGTGARYRFDGQHQDELWFRYMLRLNNWDTTASGKLPGPSGIYSSSGLGCIPSTEASPGWSARMTFQPTGEAGAEGDANRIGYYVYHLDQPGACGENFLWDPGVVVHNRWYCVEGHIRLNTPGASDGQLQGWLDGELAMQQDEMAFRRASEPDVHVREFFFNVYHGGTTTAPNNMDLTLDQLVISDTKRAPCPDPFSDDDGTAHEEAMTELKRLGVFNGCGEGLTCWKDSLTRAEMAVLMDSALELPNTTMDFFTDDDLWAEPSINRLAASGITVGCAAAQFCPYASLNRRQFAIMLDRALDLPTPSQDYFTDDDSQLGEEAINAIAEASIASGCGEGLFCPNDELSRGQAASLILRALEWADGAS